MNLYSIFRWTSLVAAVACLLLGYTLIGEWLVLFALPVVIVFWIAAGRRTTFWTGSSLLAIYVVLAVVGIMLHVSAVLMTLGCVFALAAWDLSDPRGYATGPGPREKSSLLETTHLRSLAATVGISMLLALLATSVRLQLPFGILVLLSLLLAGGIAYAVHYIRGSASARR